MEYIKPLKLYVKCCIYSLFPGERFIAFIPLPKGSVFSKRFYDCMWKERVEDDRKIMLRFLAGRWDRRLHHGGNVLGKRNITAEI